MKKLLLAIALLIGTTVAFAGSGSKQTNLVAEKNISAAIKSQIRVPEFLTEKEGEHIAAIVFRVTKSGNIKIQNIQSEDKDLEADLLSQSENIRINATGLNSKDTYKIIVKFATL